MFCIPLRFLITFLRNSCCIKRDAQYVPLMNKSIQWKVLFFKAKIVATRRWFIGLENKSLCIRLRVHALSIRWGHITLRTQVRAEEGVEGWRFAAGVPVHFTEMDCCGFFKSPLPREHLCCSLDSVRSNTQKTSTNYRCTTGQCSNLQMGALTLVMQLPLFCLK